jgi:hypothetical protein
MVAKQWARFRQYLDCRTVFARYHNITQYRRGRDFKPTLAAGAAELAPRIPGSAAPRRMRIPCIGLRPDGRSAD